MHYAQSTRDPRIRLVIIEVMEATFGVFIDALHSSSVGTELDKQLEFFGLKHRVAESNHSLGSWVDGETASRKLRRIILTDGSRQLGFQLVDDLFRQFNRMFDEWHSLTNSYQQNINSSHCVLHNYPSP